MVETFHKVLLYMIMKEVNTIMRLQLNLLATVETLMLLKIGGVNLMKLIWLHIKRLVESKSLLVV